MKVKRKFKYIIWTIYYNFKVKESFLVNDSLMLLSYKFITVKRNIRRKFNFNYKISLIYVLFFMLEVY